MKKEFDQEKAKIIVTILPFVLIVLVLFITFVVSAVKNKNNSESRNEDLQESIMDYADENMPEQNAGEKQEIAVATPAQTGAEEKTDGKADASPLPEQTPYQEIMQNGTVDYSKITYDKDSQLKEMMGYWADSNQKALDDLASLDRFRAMSYSLRGSTDFYYYGDKDSNGLPSGTGIAVYADNQYYYGTWKDGKRDGKGTFIHYHVHNDSKNTDLYTYHQYTGGFANDLPDGEGSEHFDFNTANFKKGERYVGNRIGGYSGGLLNGDFYVTTTDLNDKMEEWEGTADHGTWVYQNANKDKKGNRTILVMIGNEENFIWMQPSANKNIGVPCLISKYKIAE